MTSNKYSFLPQKNFIFSLNTYLHQNFHPSFIVNHPAHLYFISESIGQYKFNTITFLSPINAAAYLGIRWWLALMKECQPYFNYPTSHILDCQDNAGLALAALRLGQKEIFFNRNSTQLQTIQERAKLMNHRVHIKKPISFSLIPLKFNINQ